MVYGIVIKIPKGKVATYGQIARLAGSLNAARAVGAYLRINPDAPQVPCHRVVGFDGKLIGYSAKGGVAHKQKLLKQEGVQFKQEKVDLTKSLWNV